MIILTLSPYEVRYCLHHAKSTAWGGKSSIRENRQDTLRIDQVIGHLGEYAGSVYLTGHPQEYYKSQLFSQELHKYDAKLGDGGQDIIGLNLDFKTSKQYEDRSPLEHLLPVRPNELRKNWVYMLMIVMNNNGHELDISGQAAIDISIVGWASSDMLPKQTTKSGTFKGAYCLPAKKLIQPMPIKWNYRRYKSV